jgi:hypothetical protein
MTSNNKIESGLLKFSSHAKEQLAVHSDARLATPEPGLQRQTYSPLEARPRLARVSKFKTQQITQIAQMKRRQNWRSPQSAWLVCWIAPAFAALLLPLLLSSQPAQCADPGVVVEETDLTRRQLGLWRRSVTGF